jgi:16S rRNA (guanine527-N7)-methyltransferase
MNDTASEASVSNFAAVTARAENLAHNTDYRESYDFVTARAVAHLPVLCELCLPFVAPGGLFVAMKGRSAPQEAAEAEHAMRTLGGVLEEIRPYSIPRDADPRFLLMIRKDSPAPALYPRHFSVISKNPL